MAFGFGRKKGLSAEKPREQTRLENLKKAGAIEQEIAQLEQERNRLYAESKFEQAFRRGPFEGSGPMIPGTTIGEKKTAINKRIAELIQKHRVLMRTAMDQAVREKILSEDKVYALRKKLEKSSQELERKVE